MHILILDDNELVFTAPADYFVDPHDYRKDSTVQVATPANFWAEYNAREYWDEVWLDHDLGHHAYNGKTVTLQFYNDGDIHKDRVGLFRVITNNPSASKNMATDLVRTDVEVVCTSQVSMRDWGIHRDDLIPHDVRDHTVIRRNP